MKGVIRKELRQYFHSMTGYAFAAMFLCVSGAIFVTGNLFSQQGQIAAFFSTAASLLLYLVPILTMRMYAEERKQKTDELLLCAPVPIATVMIGKFLAAFLVFLAALTGTLAYPAILYAFGFWEPMTVAGCYAGFMLLAAALIAVGQFISVLTDSQFVAAIVTYSVFSLTAIAGSAASAVSDEWLRAALRFVSLTAHMSGFSYGVFNLAEAVYYMSIAALFLFAGVYVLQRKRVA